MRKKFVSDISNKGKDLYDHPWLDGVHKLGDKAAAFWTHAKLAWAHMRSIGSPEYAVKKAIALAHDFSLMDETRRAMLDDTLWNALRYEKAEPRKVPALLAAGLPHALVTLQKEKDGEKWAAPLAGFLYKFYESLPEAFEKLSAKSAANLLVFAQNPQQKEFIKFTKFLEQAAQTDAGAAGDGAKPNTAMLAATQAQRLILEQAGTEKTGLSILKLIAQQGEAGLKIVFPVVEASLLSTKIAGSVTPATNALRKSLIDFYQAGLEEKTGAPGLTMTVLGGLLSATQEDRKMAAANPAFRPLIELVRSKSYFTAEGFAAAASLMKVRRNDLVDKDHDIFAKSFTGSLQHPALAVLGAESILTAVDRPQYAPADHFMMGHLMQAVHQGGVKIETLSEKANACWALKARWYKDFNQKAGPVRPTPASPPPEALPAMKLQTPHP